MIAMDCCVVVTGPSECPATPGTVASHIREDAPAQAPVLARQPSELDNIEVFCSTHDSAATSTGMDDLPGYYYVALPGHATLQEHWHITQQPVHLVDDVGTDVVDTDRRNEPVAHVEIEDAFDMVSPAHAKNYWERGCPLRVLFGAVM